MKPINTESLFFEFKKRQWDEDYYYSSSSYWFTKAYWFTKEGLSTSLLSGLTEERGFEIYSSDPFFHFSESMPQTIADIPSLMEWVDWVEMKYKLTRL